MNLFGRPGERHHELGTVVELNQKELVLGVGGLEELGRRQAGFVQFFAHGTAGVEDQPNGKRSVKAGEISDFLLDFVFEETKVFLFHPGDELVQTGWSR